MEIICKSRRMGKTTDLIKLSAKSGGYIVCLCLDEANRIFHQADSMGLNIPYPITFSEFINKQYYGKGIKEFLIDNADLLLQQMSSVPIRVISLTATKEETHDKANRN